MKKTLKVVDEEEGYAFVISDEAELCESCGSGAVQPFNIYFESGGTSWCMDCLDQFEIDTDIIEVMNTIQSALTKEIEVHKKKMLRIISALK